MTSRQQLWRVELPLALPVILAGLRTSTVWTVGMATLSTPVGAPSLGNYIFAGLQTRNLTAVLVGCVAAALLALVLDGLVRALGAAVLARKRSSLVAILAVFGLLYAHAAVTFVAAANRSRSDRIVVGAKTFTEQYILEPDSVHDDRRRDRADQWTWSRRSARPWRSMRFAPATSTPTSTTRARSGPPSCVAIPPSVDRETVLGGGRPLPQGRARHRGRRRARLRECLRDGDAPRTCRRPAGSQPHAISRRTPRGLSVGGDYEFFQRPEWRAIQERYGLSFREQRSMDPSLMYEAVANRQVDLIGAFSTDGRIAALDLVVLEDERHAIPPYDAVILASSTLTREHPDAISGIAGTERH